MFGIFLDISSMSVCTTRHRKMFGRLVQELNVCTVCITRFDYIITLNNTIHQYFTTNLSSVYLNMSLEINVNNR